MSNDEPINIGGDGELTAAEYVLGTLSAAEWRAAELRLAREPEFATEVAFWEARLSALAGGVPAIAAPADGWTRIESAIAKIERSAKELGLWQSITVWRACAFSASALAAACLAALIYFGSLVPSAPLLARLDAGEGRAGFVAAVNPGDGSLTIVPAALLSAEQKSMELWLIPPGDRPHSLGLIDPNRAVTISVPKNLLTHLSSDAVLAVSLEPLGGSPTGQPTGPVIANGKLASL